MKWVSMADLVTFLSILSLSVNLSMKWVSMADLATLFLFPQPVSDFEHVEMGVNG